MKRYLRDATLTRQEKKSRINRMATLPSNNFKIALRRASPQKPENMDLGIFENQSRLDQRSAAIAGEKEVRHQKLMQR